ncbi:hypothetical protein HZH68_006065 [Vespula germanica]|uniref:Uncharacterized protein n=1 Tax=Vespula germanica TaxID=30212 RepID=A0A834KCL7_VESGE|nr:hypothetical protein HZH68_006065 [Vespula germanica]
MDHVQYGDKFHRVATKFWEIKEPPMKRFNRLSKLNMRSILSIIHITILRQDMSSVQNDRPYLGDSYTTAFKIFYALERVFVENPAFKEQYLTSMKEYRDLWHMSEVP